MKPTDEQELLKRKNIKELEGLLLAQTKTIGELCERNCELLTKLHIDHVKWDREKVAGWLKSRTVKDRQARVPWLEDTPFEELRPETKEAWFSVADQLKETLGD